VEPQTQSYSPFNTTPSSILGKVAVFGVPKTEQMMVFTFKMDGLTSKVDGFTNTMDGFTPTI